MSEGDGGPADHAESYVGSFCVHVNAPIFKSFLWWTKKCPFVSYYLQMILFSNRKIKITFEDLNEYLVCHNYDEKAEVHRSSERRALPLGTMPAVLRSKPVDLPAGRKFHYKFNDGSSFI